MTDTKRTPEPVNLVNLSVPLLRATDEVVIIHAVECVLSHVIGVSDSPLDVKQDTMNAVMAYLTEKFKDRRHG